MYVCMHAWICFSVSGIGVCLVGDGGEEFLETHLEAVCPLQLRCRNIEQLRAVGGRERERESERERAGERARGRERERGE